MWPLPLVVKVYHKTEPAPTWFKKSVVRIWIWNHISGYFLLQGRYHMYLKHIFLLEYYSGLYLDTPIKPHISKTSQNWLHYRNVIADLHLGSGAWLEDGVHCGHELEGSSLGSSLSLSLFSSHSGPSTLFCAMALNHTVLLCSQWARTETLQFWAKRPLSHFKCWVSSTFSQQWTKSLRHLFPRKPHYYQYFTMRKSESM